MSYLPGILRLAMTYCWTDRDVDQITPLSDTSRIAAEPNSSARADQSHVMAVQWPRLNVAWMNRLVKDVAQRSCHVYMEQSFWKDCFQILICKMVSHSEIRTVFTLGIFQPLKTRRRV
jgi:hypothetical protein